MPRWVDLSAHGLALKVRKQDDLSWLVLEALAGAGPIPADPAAQLGFTLREGVYQREGSKISLGEVQRVFPKAGVREFEVDELRASPQRSPVASAPDAKSTPWWESSVGAQYATVYLIGASRGKETLTLAPEGDGYIARATQAGVLRERIGTVSEIQHWLQTDVLVGMGDAVFGKAGKTLEDALARLRLVKGEDLLRGRPAAVQAQAPAGPVIEVVAPPTVVVPPGGWLNVLESLSVRGSVPINKVPWLKIERDKWTDGHTIVDTAMLAAQAERRTDVLEGEAIRVHSSALEAMQESGHLVVVAVGDQEPPGPAAADIKAAASLSLAQFKQQATAHHEGQRWQVQLEGRPLFVPPELGAQSARKRPDTILTEAHEAQVRYVVKRNPYECASLASLVDYPALAFPGPMSRGRKAELNIMRLLSKLGIADRLMEGEEGYCRLKNEPYMDLVIERHGWEKPDQLYLTHYFDQNGDRVLDAEMVFRIDHGRLWFKETATISLRGGELRGHDRAFANMFSQNLLNQGFGGATVEWPNDPAPRAEEEVPQSTLTPH